MDRRTFVTLAGSAGLMLGAGFADGATEVKLPAPPPIERHGLSGYPRSPLGMPGLYPGRVVEAHARTGHERAYGREFGQGGVVAVFRAPGHRGRQN